MKKAIAILMLVLMMFVGGCSGVLLNAEYSQLLDRTTVLSAETALRAQQGQLTPDEMKTALIKQAETWRRFKDARDGVKGDVIE